jgi:hypothetical protein
VSERGACRATPPPPPATAHATAPAAPFPCAAALVWPGGLEWSGVAAAPRVPLRDAEVLPVTLADLPLPSTCLSLPLVAQELQLAAGRRKTADGGVAGAPAATLPTASLALGTADSWERLVEDESTTAEEEAAWFAVAAEMARAAVGPLPPATVTAVTTLLRLHPQAVYCSGATPAALPALMECNPALAVEVVAAVASIAAADVTAE